ncbi:MAG TPA: squalene/phytoene synthase family protein [Longimicrobium sp.]|nr:squalene/phytoene synthase family protein [Longimicrobium sp.]
MSGRREAGETMDALRARAARSLAATAEEAERGGMRRVEMRGQLIRPLAALASARALGRAEDDAFWRAALAVQLAHEASLVHDDIVDAAETRRGEPTAVAAAGVGAALVLGDHLLTWAYRMAARTGSLDFAERFAVAVERTVAGEMAQGRSIGRVLAWEEYERIALDKAGALLGCAVAAAPSVAGRSDAGKFEALGMRLGLLYQMLDDLLDYCPTADAGKPALGDYAQRRWTWILDELPDAAFGRDPAEVAAAMHRPAADGETPMRRALARLETEFAAFDFRRAALLPDDDVLAPLAAGWRARARAAVAREESAQRVLAEVIVALPTSSSPALTIIPSTDPHPLDASNLNGRSSSIDAPNPIDGSITINGSNPIDRSTSIDRSNLIDPSNPDPSHSRTLALSHSRTSSLIRARVPAPAEWRDYLGRNSRSFAFASRFFPRAEGERVARVYAFCRVTDDLVDRPEGNDAVALEAVLDEWVGLAGRAYGGGATGIDLLDRAMGEMAQADVPFAYAAELVEGMRMDLRRETYGSLAELRVYTYRVASVVGCWLTELFGVHDAPTLSRAAAMGHAMQLTNILRDVGEDLRNGRLYLPADAMRRHGVTEAGLRAAMEGTRPVDAGYRALVEELMGVAEADYRAAFAALPRLPGFFQRPAAVASHVYRGIHDALRRQGHDNLRRRAHTTPGEKAVLAARALWELRGARRRLDNLEGAADPVLLPEPGGPVPAGGAWIK